MYFLHQKATERKNFAVFEDLLWVIAKLDIFKIAISNEQIEIEGKEMAYPDREFSALSRNALILLIIIHTGIYYFPVMPGKKVSCKFALFR